QRITLSTINRSGEHLLRLINDVLDLTKIDSGQIELQPEVCDLYRLLDDIYQMMSMRAKSKQIGFHFELAPDLPRFISIDANKLRQILINLLSNAVKFTNHGEVRLHAASLSSHAASDAPLELTRPLRNATPLDSYREAHQLGSPVRLRLAVSDTGEGIAPYDIDRLFQPFVQTDSGHHQAEGSGLGLAISRRYARLMGGDIEVASQQHHGSQFLVTVDCEEAAEHLMQAVTSPKIVDGLAEEQPTYRILLVDDRFENRDMLHRLLGDIGFDVQQARDGQEALELWELWHPHLIFMDIRMPVMDGLQATQVIREREPNRATKIVAITAGAFSSDREAVLAAGCDGFLVKPFKIPEIFEQLQDRLGLEYRYRDQPVPEVKLVPTADLHLSACEIERLNQHWLDQLKQACLEGDDRAAEQLVSTLPGDRRDTASKLSSLIADFHFDRIIAWIET
ncbi:MAG: response regulator, partial [Cyanobacteria bacterium J06597_1]